MKRESRYWLRRGQAVLVLAFIFIYLIFIGDPEFLARAGIMRIETSWSRWIAISRGIFVITCAIAFIGSWGWDFYTKQVLAFIAVSSTANLVTDFPIIYQLGMDEPSIAYILLCVARASLSSLLISLYLDLDKAPRERRLFKSILALRLPKTD